MPTSSHTTWRSLARLMREECEATAGELRVGNETRSLQSLEWEAGRSKEGNRPALSWRCIQERLLKDPPMACFPSDHRVLLQNRMKNGPATLIYCFVSIPATSCLSGNADSKKAPGRATGRNQRSSGDFHC